MTIDPTTVPIGAVVQCDPTGVRTHLRNTECPEMGITRVFVPVPDGMTHDEAVAALADAGAWVEVEDHRQLPKGARVREERQWAFGMQNASRWVHRDDLPPTDPDAELVEKMARAAWETQEGGDWADVSDGMRRAGLNEARAALAVVREHEATR